KLRVVSHRRFRSFRKFVPVTAFILSALITPTFDIINQTMVAVPIIMLYEVGLFLAWIARPEEGSRRVLTKIRSVIVGILRRFAVLVALPLAVLLGLLYMIALFGVFVFDGHLSTEMRSKGKRRLDRAYRKATKTIAKVLFLVRAGWMENE
ncbi:MAG: twin-arginine translocase subunit TatC, partial [Gammaproteobacteria bacterium]|nr:twin-arginine translocase subunit TatC [Gammaproteobacteria bacterium]